MAQHSCAESHSLERSVLINSAASVGSQASVWIVTTLGRISVFNGLVRDSTWLPTLLNAMTTQKAHMGTEPCFSVMCVQGININ